MTEPRDPAEPEPTPEPGPDAPAPTEAPPIVINTPSVTVHEDDDTEDPQP